LSSEVGESNTLFKADCFSISTSVAATLHPFQEVSVSIVSSIAAGERHVLCEFKPGLEGIPAIEYQPSMGNRGYWNIVASVLKS